jgi:predicted fused transcriptional regulator/phosphomethylpyrimidine kinase
MPPNDDLTPNTDEMQTMKGRILDIQERRRGRIRWQMGKHTAELAIAALAETRPYRASGKCRRRKRSKRLL